MDVNSEIDRRLSWYFAQNNSGSVGDDVLITLNTKFGIVNDIVRLFFDDLVELDWRWHVFRYIILVKYVPGEAHTDKQRVLDVINDGLTLTQDDLPYVTISKFIQIFNEPVVSWNMSQCTHASGLFANAFSFAGRFSETFVEKFASEVMQSRRKVVGLLAGAPFASSEALITEYELVLKHETFPVKQLLRTARRGAMGADSRIISSYRCFATRRRLTKTNNPLTKGNVHCHRADPQYATLLLGLRFLDYREEKELGGDPVRERVTAKLQALLEKEFLPPPADDDETTTAGGGGENEATTQRRPSLYRQMVGWLKVHPEPERPPRTKSEEDVDALFSEATLRERKAVVDRETSRAQLLRTFHWLAMVAVRMTLNREGVTRVQKARSIAATKGGGETVETHFRRLYRAARASHGRRVYGLYLLSEFRKRLAPPEPIFSQDDNEDTRRSIREAWRKKCLLPVSDHVFHQLVEDCAHGNRDYELVFGEIKEWDVTGVSDMSGAFKNWPFFDEDLSGWVPPKNVDTTDMFKYVRFQDGKLRAWLAAVRGAKEEV